jgi:hypothetical protein
MSSPRWVVVAAPTPAPRRPAATPASAPSLTPWEISLLTAQTEAAAVERVEGRRAPGPGLGVAHQQHADAVLGAEDEPGLQQFRDDQNGVRVLDIDPHLLEARIVEERFQGEPRALDHPLLTIGGLGLRGCPEQREQRQPQHRCHPPGGSDHAFCSSCWRPRSRARWPEARQTCGILSRCCRNQLKRA